jgi:hypothetical protein
MWRNKTLQLKRDDQFQTDYAERFWITPFSS